MSGIMGFPYFNYLQLFYLIMLCSTQTIFKSKLQKLLVFTTKKKKNVIGITTMSTVCQQLINHVYTSMNI